MNPICGCARFLTVGYTCWQSKYSFRFIDLTFVTYRSKSCCFFDIKTQKNKGRGNGYSFNGRKTSWSQEQ